MKLYVLFINLIIVVFYFWCIINLFYSNYFINSYFYSLNLIKDFNLSRRGGFWAKYLISWNDRSRCGDLLVFFLLKEVLSASSYGHFTAAKEFWSQCNIFRFGNEQFEICWGNQRDAPRGITQGNRHSGAFIYWVGTL